MQESECGKCGKLYLTEINNIISTARKEIVCQWNP